VLSREDVSPEKSRRYLELLHNGLERIRLTVGQLLRFTPRQARPSLVALEGPIEDSIALVRHRALRQGVEIRFVRGAPEGSHADDMNDAALVDGQANELGQALLNLLVNSLDALEPKPAGEGRIDVFLWREGAELRIEVADNGPGVPPEELGRVADLFYTTKDPGKGTGLGLSIVYQVVASHHGSLEFTSRPGDGFRVRITLPAKVRGQAAEAGR
jgi:two-component system NtrC family sensor kinase